MKISFIKQLFILAICFVSINLFAQTKQQGVVKILNSNHKTLAGVEIIFHGAKPVYSDKNGGFILDFEDKKYGDIIIYGKTNKKGYEIVNLKEIEVSKLSKEKLKIILCPSGEIIQNKLDYFNTSVKSIVEGYQRKTGQLKKQLDKGKINKAIFNLEQKELLSEKGNALEYADKLAEQFARTNFDDVSGLYKKAFGFFKKGKIDKSIEILEEANQNAKKKNKIEQEDIWTMKLSAQMYMMTFQYQKADEMFYTLWKLDTTNIGNTNTYADFLSYRNQHKKSILFYNKLLKLDIKTWKKGDVYRILGRVYEEMVDFPQALLFYQKYNEVYEKMCKIESRNDFYNHHLALSYLHLSQIYYKQGSFEQAKKLGIRANELLKELYQDNPSDLTVKSNLSASYNNLGDYYQNKYAFAKAEKMFSLNLDLNLELSRNNPKNRDYKKDLANSYQELASIYKNQSRVDKEREALNHCLELSKELYQSNPQDDEIKYLLGDAYQDMAEFYRNKGDLDGLDKAEELAVQGLDLKKDLYKNDPENKKYKITLGNTYSVLGSIYLTKGNLDKAESFLLLGINLLKEVYESGLQIQIVKVAIVGYEQMLAGVYLEQGKIDEAKELFIHQIPLFEELYKNNPKSDLYYMPIGIAYLQLGRISMEKKEEKEGIDYYKKSYKVFDELYQMTQMDFYKTMLDGLKIEIDNFEKTKAQQMTESLSQIEKLKKETQTKNTKMIISLHYGKLSWLYLFENKFEEAESAAFTALEYDKSQGWVKTNLAHSLLFRGKYQEAKEIYLELKGQNFTETLLKDLTELEEAGLSHKDMEKIRELLK